MGHPEEGQHDAELGGSRATKARRLVTFRWGRSASCTMLLFSGFYGGDGHGRGQRVVGYTTCLRVGKAGLSWNRMAAAAGRMAELLPLLLPPGPS